MARRKTLCSATLATLAVAATTTLHSQIISGELADRATGTPIPGAFVTLIDNTGAEVARVLTGASGTFLIQAPGPGAYRVRSKRIGFRPTESALIGLNEGQSIWYRLESEALPVQLPALIVAGRPQCGMRDDSAAIAFRLWDEAREALAAVRWTKQQGTYWHHVERFERDRPLRAQEVTAERHNAWAAAREKPFQAIAAEQLAARGYVVAAPGAGADSTDYYAPDDDVLLGDLFLNTHCFSARDGGTERPGQVGLAFEPAPGRRVPDVVGVLWLDKRTLKLSTLEFNYTGLVDPTLGGRVAFAPLPSGPWIVTDWSIRMARMDTTVRRDRRRRPMPPRVIAIREAGGMVMSVRSPSGTVEFAGAPSVIEGIVVDSSRGGHPLAGARVTLVGTDRGDSTDGHGRFRISGALEGQYRVGFEHPRLDSLWVEPQTRVTVMRGQQVSLTLFIPKEGELLRQLCPHGVSGDWPAIVGLVIDTASARVPNAAIRVQRPGRESPVSRGKADAKGRFVLCGVPRGPFSIVVGADSVESEVTFAFAANGVLIDGERFHEFTGRIWTQVFQRGHRPPERRDSVPRGARHAAHSRTLVRD